MNEKFRVIFLEEAKDFLDGLDEKTREKILFNIRKAQVINDLNYLRNLLPKSGNSEPFIIKNIIVFLLFGINLLIRIR